MHQNVECLFPNNSFPERLYQFTVSLSGVLQHLLKIFYINSKLAGAKEPCPLSIQLFAY